MFYIVLKYMERVKALTLVFEKQANRFLWFLITILILRMCHFESKSLIPALF